MSAAPDAAAYPLPHLPIVMVACCGQKLDRAAPAEDLYTSDLFRKSRAWAERFGVYWFILSAKHGVVAPGQVIKPYDETLNDMDPHELAMWGKRVSYQWGESDRWGKGRRPVVVLAGSRYRRWCDGRGWHVPMAGLGIGHQKAWLKAQLSQAVPA